MDDSIRLQILDILEQNRIMAVATLRPDGWPQVTTVGYAHEGLVIYFLCGQDSQKAENLRRDGRVSLAINTDNPQVMEITGLSMAAQAEEITDPAEAGRVLQLLISRYPQQASMPGPMPEDAMGLCIVKLTPRIISLIDYSKGFGHTDLVAA